MLSLATIVNIFGQTIQSNTRGVEKGMEYNCGTESGYVVQRLREQSYGFGLDLRPILQEVKSFMLCPVKPGKPP